ncbi:tail fiber domain-containing protein, partial [Flavobacteriaceae bacterium]|nr:tail fiber domain-containing protein [Flavobacteriaceae bacterium]
AVTPTLDQITDVGSTTTNGIAVGGLTVNSAYNLPTATGTAGQLLTVSTTTSKLVFTTPATTVTPTLDQVTDVGSTTTNSIEVGGATVTGDLTVNTNTTLQGNTTIGDATSDDITITARLDSDLIPKTNNTSNLGDSALNFGEVNTRNLLSNAAMTVSATGILTLNSSATGTPTISFQQGGTEMAGIGSSTFFVGDSAAGTHYFLPPQYNVSRVSGYDPNETSVLGTNSAFFPNEMVFVNVNDVVTKTISDVTQIDNATPYGILITGGAFTVSGTSSGFNDDVSIQGSLTDSLTISLGLINGTDVLNIDALLDSSIALKRGTLNIGTPSVTLQTLYTQFIDSGTNSELNLNSGDENGEVKFTVDSSTIAGVNSSTLMVTNGSSFYAFPEISTLPATPENQVLAYTATNTLNFYTLPFPITGTVTGSTLRYNPTSSVWEETKLIRYDPTNGGSTTVTISGTLTPGVDNTFSLGTTSNEFSKTYTQGISTSEDYLTLTTKGQNAYLKLNGWGTFGAFYLNGITSQQNDKGNTVIGDDSFTTLSSTPEFNTVLGFQNLNNSSLTGSNNIAIGKSNQKNNVSGSYNISIGVNALAANIGGDDLIAIGRNALEKDTTGTENIAIGLGTLSKNIGGDSNLAIGYQALYDATSSDNNVAIGKRALTTLSSSNNTAVGNLALDSSNSGGNNVAIGYRANLSSNSIANGIAIGANALVTASNTVQLGDSNITAVNTSGVVSATGFIDSSLGATREVLLVGSGDRIVSDDNISMGTDGRLLLNNAASTASYIILETTVTDGNLPELKIEAFDATSTWGRKTLHINNTDAVHNFVWSDDLLPYHVAGANGENLGSSAYRWKEIWAEDITSTKAVEVDSDRRLKSNITSINEALSIVEKINPVFYNKYRTIEKQGTPFEEFGFIAQEIREVLPQLVKEGETEDKLLSMNYTGIIPILTKAIQEQQQTIAKNQSEIKQLKAQLEILQKAVEGLMNTPEN